MFDVIVIGGGVVGGLILRELTKYNINCCMLEKENDVATGQSRANSGIVHAGYDAKEGTLKAKFNLLGNLMMEDVTRDLGVKFINNGSLVVAFSEEDIKVINSLKIRGEKNGVKDLEIISKEKLHELEPNISDEAIGALYAKTGGIVCPYELTVASIGNAMDNGALLKTNFYVTSIKKQDDYFIIASENGQEVKGKLIINSAGLNADKIANMAGDFSFKMGARRGQYILLDKECCNLVNHTLFFTPTKMGKGILVTRTVDGNILLGPTAVEQSDGNTKTDSEGFDFIIEKAKKMVKNPPLNQTITSFSGVRAYCDRHDFIIENSGQVKGLINVAGIESPGLTSAPAIADYVVNKLVSCFIPLTINKNFNGKRKADYFFHNLSIEEKNKIIKDNPSYGKIVCRCEQITEGEIINSLRVNPKATDIDGVKRRTRSGMGRCQGGFCQPVVAEIIAKELNIPLTEVTKSGKGSEIIIGGLK